MRHVLQAMLWSNTCKIPRVWLREIRAATKHCPYPSEKITIKGRDFCHLADESLGDFGRYVEQLDAEAREEAKMRRAERKPKNKRRMTKV